MVGCDGSLGKGTMYDTQNALNVRVICHDTTLLSKC